MVSGVGMGPGDLRQRPLFDDDFLTAQRKGHPRGTAALDLDAFCALDHLLISSDGAGFSGLVDDALARLGRTRRVTVSIQSYALAPVILANSDCVCTLPRRFLERFTHDLDVQPPPLKLASATLAALWHPRSQEDPGHRWFRECLYEAAGKGRSE
jgi:DNA-binding transcriptional LysR family regulator